MTTVVRRFEDLVRDGILAIGDGYRAKNEELGGDGPIFLRAAYLQDSGFILDRPDRFLDRDTEKFGIKISQLSDVVITTKGNSTGRVGRIRAEQSGAVYSPHLSYWRSNSHEKLDQGFLYYWSQSIEFLAQLRGMAHGTDMAPYLSLRDQLRLQVTLPDSQLQKAIGEILGSLDDKIELNRRMNETLEATARAIFRDWFVDFGPTRAKMEGRAPYLAAEVWSLFPNALDEDGVPREWVSGTLGDVARQVGESVSPESLDPDTPYFGLEHMPRRSIALSDWEGAGKVTSGKLSFRRGDFLFGKLRPYFHKVGIAPVDGICSTDIVVLNGRDRNAGAFVLTCISQDEFVAFTDRTSDGTKMPRTSWGRMERYSLCIPSPSALEAFNAVVEPMLERILSNIHESRSLAATRDFLLPKLMSGEIRVRNAEKAFEAAV